MEVNSIEALLAARGAWLKGDTGDQEEALARKPLTQMIAGNYRVFEEVRDRIFKNTESFMRHVEFLPDTLNDEGHALVDELLKHGAVRKEEHGHEICEVAGRRYMSGGWLEELAWLAAMDAGADEAFYGQCVGWSVKGYTGENEIDLIMRKGNVLGFISCKALRADLDMHDRKHRNRLMDAVHEADNLADHFGRPGERVAVLVTTDLFDEVKGSVRYNALMGKAAILDVRLIALEQLGYDTLVNTLASMWEEKSE
jgi:hypothetical protein